MVRRVPWEAGSLWPKLKAQSAHGLAVGALQSIETNTACVEDEDVRFRVYVLANLLRKEKAREQQGKTTPQNPFLPYEDDLYVCDLSETHLCLLNKFNVVDHHFLIVTRQYESQENWLTIADFEALAQCLAEVDGLAFFNGGQDAGSSQPHKHLQVVPRTLDIEADREAEADFPMEVLIARIVKAMFASGAELSLNDLPFLSAIAPISNPPAKNTPETSPSENVAISKTYHQTYQQLLAAVGITSDNGYTGKQTAAYNFLCTRQWMMIVPRICEKHLQVSVNSLGFAGTLLVKNQEQLSQLEAFGPMQLLRAVSSEAADS